ncbi:MAG TPA: enoyl-CoA hydratase-related protein [Thermoanaerobaculia bacterium]|nr:enoyl-CoA hydratase-related protein [Thermoanaerobaculia bacterium]
MSPTYRSLRYETGGAVARVVLTRPEVRNAFDDVLIEELTRAFAAAGEDAAVRVVLLSGDGPIFCAGADVNWMRKAGGYSREENEADAERMARMLRGIDACPKPVVALVQGAAIGGGVGLVAAADIAIASEETVFSLAEVRLGILPAAISPYVLRAIGPRAARDVFLTGERFDAREAERIGLVHRVVPLAELAEAGRRKVAALLSAGPEAVRAAKALIEKVTGLGPEEAMPLTVRTIAERRASAEAKEGLSAFLEKRRPAWAKELEK